MNAKNYFDRSLNLEERINIKLEEVEMLKALSRRTTAMLSGMPGTHDPVKRTMADTADRVIDLQQEINHDIEELLSMKMELRTVIKQIPDTEAQWILEARYFCGKSWKEIAVQARRSLRWIHILHDRAIVAAEPYIPY